MFINKKIVFPFNFSETFLGDQEDGDSVFIHISDYERITSHLESDDVSLIFKMYDYKNNNTSIIVRIGGFHLDDKNIVYVPQWIIDSVEFKNKVTFKQIYNVPIATKLKLQLFDENEIYGTETKELFELSLQKYGCVELNRTISLKLPDLDITIIGLISGLEPIDENGYSRFNGEVEVDIVTLQKEPSPVGFKPPQEIDSSPLHEESIPLTKEELREARLRRFQ